MPISPSRLRATYELTAKDLSLATGAHLRTVRKWEADDDVVIQERFVTRLEGLQTVLDTLDGLSLAFVHNWLRQPKDSLGGVPPREALGKGQWEQVLHQARITAAAVPQVPAMIGAGRDGQRQALTNTDS